MTVLRIPISVAAVFATLLFAASGSAQVVAKAGAKLGLAPVAPTDISKLPGGGAHKLQAGSGFTVNGVSREQVRQFYNSVFLASEYVPIDSTAVISNCVAGSEAAAFLTAEAWRINWFRGMGGIPAAVTFSTSEDAEDQDGALMMSANNTLQHTNIPMTWSCFSTDGTNAADNSNLALGSDGPDAITGYIWDYGENPEAGHRRWILYPQTQIMAGGDVPTQGAYEPANATWVFDANFGGPRPATTYPYVAWPPPGYVPYPVVFPQWSFALSNADLSEAGVTMTSNGVAVSIAIQPYAVGYGENAVVWYPTHLNPVSNVDFPFSGSDTVYDITVTNVNTVNGTQSFSYSVTLFDPSVPGSDYVPTVLSGTNHPSVNENNPYACTLSVNPNCTGYQFVAAQPTNGDLSDNGSDGLVNFTMNPPPEYSVITNPPVGSGKCFHLTHTNPAPQLLQFNEILFPATNSALSFKSLLGYAATTEVARVQISTNDGAWFDIYTQAGTGGSGQTTFAAHTLLLSNYAGRLTSVRFNYDYIAGGSYYPETSTNVGWCIESIVLTNTSQGVNFVTNTTASNTFNYVPTLAGNWILEARAIIFDQFGLDWSLAGQLVVVTNKAPTLVTLGIPSLTAGQAQIPFTLEQGPASTFALMQASEITGPWTTNASAVLSDVVAGFSYQFAAPAPVATEFYRVQAR